MPLWPFRRREAVAHVAATEALTPGHARYMRRTKQPWQERAAWFAEWMGAIRFASGIKADAGSRCQILPEVCVDPRNDTWEPVGKADAILTDVLHAYRGEHEGPQELIRQHLWHYDVSGEVFQTIKTCRGKAQFSIRSTLHAEYRADGIMLRDIPGGTIMEGTAVLYPWESIKRLWVPDPNWPGWATSPLKGVLADCERYWALARRVRREAQSALTGNGILHTPAEAHVPLPAQQVGAGPGPETNIEALFYGTAERALDDDDAPEAFAPLMTRWANELNPPVRVETASPLSGEAIALRQEALEAIGRGLDYPQRLFVTGTGDGNHWSDWLLKEEFAAESLAPALEKVCWRDVTDSFFRPALRQLNAKGLWRGDPERYRVGFDMTPVLVHPDMTTQAIELYKIGVLSDTKLLTTTGFDPAFAPNTQELGRWIMRTQIQRETIRAQDPNANPAIESTTISRSIPSPSGPMEPGMAAAATAVIDLPRIGPLPSERLGWLD